MFNRQSITGTAVAVPEYYTYSANEGERVETVHYGSENSPRYVTTVYDALDRVSRIERPAFGGGVITKTYTYGAGTKCGPTLIQETVSLIKWQA